MSALLVDYLIKNTVAKVDVLSLRGTNHALFTIALQLTCKQGKGTHQNYHYFHWKLSLGLVIQRFNIIGVDAVFIQEKSAQFNLYPPRSGKRVNFSETFPTISHNAALC